MKKPKLVKIISTAVSVEFYEKVKLLADKEKRSISNYVRILLEGEAKRLEEK